MKALLLLVEYQDLSEYLPNVLKHTRSIPNMQPVQHTIIIEQ